jgi:hypothetical protein
MANTITITTQHSNKRNLALVIDIVGDGSGDETAALIASPDTGGELKLTRVQANAMGFSAALLWDADTDVTAFRLAAGGNYDEFLPSGGLINRAGTGKTGTMLLATTGMGSGDTASISLEFKKRRLT